MQYEYSEDDALLHYGILGMKWGVRKDNAPQGTPGWRFPKDGEPRPKPKQTIGRRVKAGARQAGINTSLAIKGAKTKVSVGEAKHTIRRAIQRPSSMESKVAKLTQDATRLGGKLTTDKESLKAIEKVGITRHKEAVYDNFDKNDLRMMKKYTDSAYYSRGVNSYLATGGPENFAKAAAEVKKTIQKNKVSDQTVYRSLNLTFSTNGVSKKLDTHGEAELAKLFDSMSSNFQNRSFAENRLYSTSTSPLFAIDTWREINPTAASTYNAYLVIDCKDTPGVYADGRTSSGQKLVNTASNQEVILAPNKMTYKKMAFDEERGMFAIYMDAS